MIRLALLVLGKYWGIFGGPWACLESLRDGGGRLDPVAFSDCSEERILSEITVEGGRFKQQLHTY